MRTSARGRWVYRNTNTNTDTIANTNTNLQVGEREVVLLAIRSITIVLVILGSVLLTFKVWKRRRGSWKEAAAAVFIQIIWQVSESDLFQSFIRVTFFTGTPLKG